MRTIRPATEADLPEMMQIFAEARQFMAQTGNPSQWPPTYPSAEILRADLAAGRSYVCEEDGAMVATFCFGIFDDPTYAEIYDGAWLRDAPYGVIHRIATRAHGGAASDCVAYCIAHTAPQGIDLRVDTHRNNVVMQKFLKKHGFVYCGVIHLADWTHDGDDRDRVAFQRVGEIHQVPLGI